MATYMDYFWNTTTEQGDLIAKNWHFRKIKVFGNFLMIRFVFVIFLNYFGNLLRPIGPFFIVVIGQILKN